MIAKPRNSPSKTLIVIAFVSGLVKFECDPGGGGIAGIRAKEELSADIDRDMVTDEGKSQLNLRLWISIYTKMYAQGTEKLALRY